MTPENNKNEPELQFIIDEEYVASILESTFEAEFTDDQWQEFFYDRIGEPIYSAVYETIFNMLNDKQQAEIKDHKPYCSVQIKNPHSAYGIFKDFTELQAFSSESEAQAYMDRQQKMPYVEYKIEVVE